MPKILTATDIEFRDFHITREEIPGEPIRWFAEVRYIVLTQEGETWNRVERAELTGAIKTKAINLLADVRTAILQKEGL